MTGRDTRPPRPSVSAAAIAIHNRLLPGHRYQAAVDEVLRVALHGLPGPWDVSVYPAGQAWFRIDVVAPDGARWSTSVRVHDVPRVDDLADRVRTACVRHSRRAGVPSVSSPAAAQGAPK